MSSWLCSTAITMTLIQCSVSVWCSVLLPVLSSLPAWLTIQSLFSLCLVLCPATISEWFTCLNHNSVICWIKLEMLKQSKIILKSLTSFCWHPYWSHFIRSLRNVRLNKIFERTYQDGAGVGLVVDKERGVFGTNMCTYHKEKELVCPPLWC